MLGKWRLRRFGADESGQDRALAVQVEQTMPLYFMHLRDGKGVLLDPDGVDMPMAAVAAAALRAARDCIAGDARRGRIDFKYRIDVEDEHGTIVHSLPFADAIEIIPASAMFLDLKSRSG